MVFETDEAIYSDNLNEFVRRYRGRPIPRQVVKNLCKAGCYDILEYLLENLNFRDELSKRSFAASIGELITLELKRDQSMIRTALIKLKRLLANLGQSVNLGELPGVVAQVAELEAVVPKQYWAALLNPIELEQVNKVRAPIIMVREQVAIPQAIACVSEKFHASAYGCNSQSKGIKLDIWDVLREMMRQSIKLDEHRSCAMAG